MSQPTLTPNPNHERPCADLIRLTERVNNLIIVTDANTRDIRPLIELAAQIKLLMTLSIGGGMLAIINLIIILSKSLL